MTTTTSPGAGEAETDPAELWEQCPPPAYSSLREAAQAWHQRATELTSTGRPMPWFPVPVIPGTVPAVQCFPMGKGAAKVLKDIAHKQPARWLPDLAAGPDAADPIKARALAWKGKALLLADVLEAIDYAEAEGLPIGLGLVFPEGGDGAAVDVDRKHWPAGGEGDAAFAADIAALLQWAEDHGCYVEATPGGGVHVVGVRPAGAKPWPGKFGCSGSAIDGGGEIRGGGSNGFLVVAPTHRAGKAEPYASAMVPTVGALPEALEDMGLRPAADRRAQAPEPPRPAPAPPAAGHWPDPWATHPPAGRNGNGSEPPPRPYEELERLVSSYPTIRKKQGQRDEARDFVCGLTRCMEAIGKGKADAIALASRHHPEAADTFEQVERWPFEKHSVDSFIAQCKAARVDVTRHDLKGHRQEPPPGCFGPEPEPPTSNGNGYRQMGEGEREAPAAAAGDDADAEDLAIEREEIAADLRRFRAVDRIGEQATPERLFSPGLAERITAFAEQQQVTTKGYYLPILTTTASIAGNRVIVAAEPGNDWVEPLNLWGKNLSDVGDGKSPTSGPATSGALKPWRAREVEKYKAAISQWKRDKMAAEGKAKNAKDYGENGAEIIASFLETNPQPQMRQLFANDVTFEKLESLLAEPVNHGILVLNDELGRWFAQLTRGQHQDDRPKWLALHPGEQISTLRMGREAVFADRPAVSIFGNLQPQRMEALWKADAKANDGCPDADGLWSRFLMVNLPPWQYRYESSTVRLAPVLLAAYQQVDEAVGRLPAQPDGRQYVLSLAPDALPIFREWVDELGKMTAATSDTPTRQYLKKQRGHTLRVAGVLHLLRLASCGLSIDAPISVHDLESAILLILLFFAERQKAFATLSDNSGAVKKLLGKGREWRAEHGTRPVPYRVVRGWDLPERKSAAKAVRSWLQGVVQRPGCGAVAGEGAGLVWHPPGDDE